MNTGIMVQSKDYITLDTIGGRNTYCCCVISTIRRLLIPASAKDEVLLNRAGRFGAQWCVEYYVTMETVMPTALIWVNWTSPTTIFGTGVDDEVMRECTIILVIGSQRNDFRFNNTSVRRTVYGWVEHTQVAVTFGGRMLNGNVLTTPGYTLITKCKVIVT